jgi:hypothetical protein
MLMSFHRRRAVVITAAFVVGSAAAIVLSHGGDATLIHACVAKDGTIRIVGATVTCRGQETALDWNITGPQGLPGQNGAPGAQGPRGPSDAYAADAGANPQAFAVSNNEATVAMLTLPEGNYSLSAKVLVGNGDGLAAEISCTLRYGGAVLIDTAGVRLAGGAPYEAGSMATLPLGGSLVVGPAGEIVRIQCGSTSPSGFAQYGKLNAVKVETLTHQ